MERKTRLTLILLLAFGLFSCGGDSNTVSGPDLSADPVMATFSSIQSKVFTPTCAVSGCHNGTQIPTLSANVAYNNIVNQPSTQGLDYIEPGQPNESYLYRKLTGMGIIGERMPRLRGPLPQAAIDSIGAWIEMGALNN